MFFFSVSAIYVNNILPEGRVNNYTAGLCFYIGNRDQYVESM